MTWMRVFVWFFGARAVVVIVLSCRVHTMRLRAHTGRAELIRSACYVGRFIDTSHIGHFAAGGAGVGVGAFCLLVRWAVPKRFAPENMFLCQYCSARREHRGAVPVLCCVVLFGLRWKVLSLSLSEETTLKLAGNSDIVWLFCLSSCVWME